MITRSEQHVAIHQQYQESLQATVDWLNHMKEKLSLCSDSTGDRTTIQNKLDRLQVSRRLGTEFQWVLRYSGDPPLCPSLALQWGPLTTSAPLLRYNGNPPHPLCPSLALPWEPLTPSAPVLHYHGNPSPPLPQSCTTMGTPHPLCPSLALPWGPLTPSAPVLLYSGDPPHPLSAPVLHYNGDPSPLPSLFLSCTTMGTPLCPSLALQCGPPSPPLWHHSFP